MRTRILVVARDVALRARLARLLKSAGHGVELAESAAHAGRIGLDGFAVAIVARDGLGAEAARLIAEFEAKTVKTLTLGAAPGCLDPSDETGLLGAIAEALRPAPVGEHSEPVLRFGGFRLDLPGHSLTDEAGKELTLTRGEFSLLREFVQRPGRVLSRDQLLQALVGRDAESYDRSIDMLVVRLRRKIERDPKRPNLIVTVAGSGYKFAAKLTIDAATLAQTSKEALTPAPPSPPPKDAAERRQLTVLHCALSGPAFVAAQRDPEDLERLLARFQEHCAAIISAAGGTIDRLLSDGVLAYFGYPQADEHQAERALRTALRLIETTDQTNTGQRGRLQVRIGAATGLTIVGGHTSTALGEAAHVAAALAAAAKSDAVLISASTRRLVGGLFEFGPCETIAMDGASDPIQAWHVTSEATTESRFDALRGVTPARLVGREEELELLLRRWNQAKSGSGKVVLITGEPGIGKSRLIRAFQDAIAGQPHAELRFSCSPHHQDSALHPFIVQLERAMGCARDDTDEFKLIKLDAVLARSNVTDEAATVIADLLSIRTDQRERIQRLNPQARRGKALAALLAYLTGAAAQNPVLLIYEDLHWIDPTSCELLDRVVAQCERLPMLLLATLRPEFQPPWSGQPNVTSLALNRLNRQDTTAMIEEIAAEAGLPARVVQGIADRTDGVPLFVEEVTRAAIEAGQQFAEALSSTSGPASAVPATLHASLIARLDRLGPAAKDIAQKGAAVGREFSYELIAAIADRQDSELRESLDRLTSAGLVFTHGIAPECTYQFKHALVQDVAYGTLVRAARQQVHARIVGEIERQLQSINNEPEVLAYHYEQAGTMAKAHTLYLLAGRQCFVKGSHDEARSHLGSALRLTATFPEGELKDRMELEALAILTDTIGYQRGFTIPEISDRRTRMRELWDRLDRPTDFLGLVSLDLGELLHKSDAAGLLEKAAMLLRLGDETKNAAASHYGHAFAGAAGMLRGELAEAEPNLQQVLKLGETVTDSLGYSLDCRVSAQTWLGFVACWLGYPSRAVTYSSAAVSESRRLMDIPFLVESMTKRAELLSFLGDREQLERLLPELVSLARERKSFHGARVTIMQGYLLTQRGEHDRGRALIGEGLAGWAATGSSLWASYHLALLAEANQLLGDVNQAQRLLTEAMDVTERAEERWYAAELHRRLGETHRLLGDDDSAERYFERALAIARGQEAKFWELHAATSSARLLRDQGKAAEARAVLAPVHAWFSEGFDTSAWQQAKMLLDSLGRTNV